ncbi:hypothetical protein, partial [Actinomadura sp.]|uniref:DUF7453 family protein n=1 Tax=Actinomadura sp. TaxID=1989 RepID=UPI0037C92782
MRAVGLSVVIGVAVGASSAAAGPVHLRVVAAPGQQVANAGTVLDSITDFSPTIGPDGVVAFSASDSPGVRAASLFEGRPGQVRRIARRGDQAPGYPAGTGYVSISRSIRDAQGRTTFFGRFEGSSNSTALWRGTPEGVSLLMGIYPEQSAMQAATDRDVWYA